jgi:hypothetical protein
MLLLGAPTLGGPGTTIHFRQTVQPPPRRLLQVKAPFLCQLPPPTKPGPPVAAPKDFCRSIPFWQSVTLVATGVAVSLVLIFGQNARHEAKVDRDHRGAYRRGYYHFAMVDDFNEALAALGVVFLGGTVFASLEVYRRDKQKR